MESREELVNQIEEARKRLNGSIDGKESYDLIYRYSVELDRLIEQYMDADTRRAQYKIEYTPDKMRKSCLKGGFFAFYRKISIKWHLVCYCTRVGIF